MQGTGITEHNNILTALTQTSNKNRRKILYKMRIVFTDICFPERHVGFIELVVTTGRGRKTDSQLNRVRYSDDFATKYAFYSFINKTVMPCQKINFSYCSLHYFSAHSN